MEDKSVTWRSLLDRRYLPSIVLLSLALWLHATNTLMISTVLPVVVEDIGGYRFLSWAFSLYLIGSVVTGTHMTLFVHHLGLKKTMLMSAMVYLVGCVICGLANHMSVFLIGRVIQGCGGGGLVALVYISQYELFPNKLLPRIIACNSLVWMIAAFSGPMIGGLFATLGIWRMGFMVFAVQALIFIVLAQRQLSARKEVTLEKVQRASLINILLLISSILCVSSAGTQSEWWQSLLLVLGGVASLCGFVFMDKQRGSGRMLPKQITSLQSPVSSGLLMTLVFSIALMSFVVYGPLMLMKIYGLNPLATGFVLVTEAFAWSTAAIIFAGKPPEAEPRLILGGGLLVTIGVTLQGIVVPATSVALIVLVLIVACGGFGVLWGYLIRGLVEAADVEDKQRTSSIIPVVQQIGFALGAAFAGLIANSLELTEQASVADIQAMAPWIFFAFVPFALLGNWSAWNFVRAATNAQTQHAS